MFTEELGRRIAIASERAKELEEFRATHNIRTGKTYHPPRPNPNQGPRYFVGDKEYAHIKEIQEDIGLRTHHDVHFRLSSPHPKWSHWGYIRDRKRKE